MRINILLLAFVICQSYALEQCSETDEYYKDICLKVENYNKYEAPQYPKLSTVYLEIIIRKILNIDEENHFMELVAYSNLKWMEPRINIKWIDQQVARYTDSEMNPLWKALTHYTNAHNAASRLKLWTASKNKMDNSIWFKQIIIYKLEFECDMDFSNYPFDTHICVWKIRNLIENNSTVQLKIDSVQQETKNISANQNQPLLIKSPNIQFDVDIFPLESKAEYSDGQFKSIARVKFTLKRKQNALHKLVTGYFVPLGLFALLSLVSYLIKPEVVSKLNKKI